MSDKPNNTPLADDNVDKILAEILGENNSFGESFNAMYQRYAAAQPLTDSKVQPEQPAQQTAQTAAQTAASSEAAELNAEQLDAQYRAAAAKYEVNGYRITQPPAYNPYPAGGYAQPYGYAPYPPAPYGYAPYPPAPYGYAPYAQPYGYAPYYPTEYAQPEPSVPQSAPQNAAQPTPQNNAAGERVVFDADWENGKPTASVPVIRQTENGRAYVNPAFIDPISPDEDEPLWDGDEDISFSSHRKQASQEKKSDFFPEGFSGAINNSAAAAEKTVRPNPAAEAKEAMFNAFSEDYRKTQERRGEWMMTDEELEKAREKRRQAELELEEERRRIAELPTAEQEATILETADAVWKAKEEEELYEILNEHETEQPLEEAVSEVPAEDETDAEDEEQFRVPEQEEETIYYSPEVQPVFTRTDNPEKGEIDLYYNQPEREETVSAEETAVNNKKTKKEKGKFAAFIRRNTPHKGQSKKDFISCLIMDIAFLVLIGGLVFCCVYFAHYKKVSDMDDQILNIIEEGISRGEISDVEYEDIWADLHANYPDVDFPAGINPDLAKLYAVNQDVVGWLSIPGIDLVTVLTQSKDNDYYMYRDLYKAKTKYGTPFVDYRDEMHSTTLSRNTIIYGHNTHDGLKFYNLTRYLKLDGYIAAPVVSMQTLFGKTTNWKVFAVAMDDANTNEFRYLYTDFVNENEFLNLIKEIRARSFYDLPVDVVAGDNILTLYTCYQNIFEGGRLIVFAREVREGEDLYVDTSAATKNKDCIYPQAYYGKKPETTPTQPPVQPTSRPSAVVPSTAPAVTEPVVTDPVETPQEQEATVPTEPVATLAPETPENAPVG